MVDETSKEKKDKDSSHSGVEIVRRNRQKPKSAKDDRKKQIHGKDPSEKADAVDATEYPDTSDSHKSTTPKSTCDGRVEETGEEEKNMDRSRTTLRMEPQASKHRNRRKQSLSKPAKDDKNKKPKDGKKKKVDSRCRQKGRLNTTILLIDPKIGECTTGELAVELAVDSASHISEFLVNRVGSSVTPSGTIPFL